MSKNKKNKKVKCFETRQKFMRRPLDKGYFISSFPLLKLKKEMYSGIG